MINSRESKIDAPLKLGEHRGTFSQKCVILRQNCIRCTSIRQVEAAALKQVLSAAQGSAVQKTHTPILYVYVIIQPVETVLAPLSTTSAGLK